MEPVLALATPESGRAGHRSVRIVPNLTKANTRTTLVSKDIAPTQKTLESKSLGPAKKKSQNVPECPTTTDFLNNIPSAAHPVRPARNFTITRKNVTKCHTMPQIPRISRRYRKVHTLPLISKLPDATPAPPFVYHSVTYESASRIPQTKHDRSAQWEG